jgi:hypothetical protein
MLKTQLTRLVVSATTIAILMAAIAGPALAGRRITGG